MGTEIERTFLVESEEWREDAERAVALRQGYFETGPESTVRVRYRSVRSGSRDAAEDTEPTGELTIKGPATGITRPEFEYTIPASDVERMLELFCGERRIEKTRHVVDHRGATWVVDDFGAPYRGLVLAEIELESEAEGIEQPSWLGREVTREGEYTNAALARRRERGETDQLEWVGETR